jgi:hypothetical protein
MLALTAVPPCDVGTGRRRSSQSRSATRVASSAPSIPVTSSANSSPPKRAAMPSYAAPQSIRPGRDLGEDLVADHLARGSR